MASDRELLSSKDYQVMVDIETLSTRSNACILSIGAVKFSYDEGIVDRFYRNVRFEEQKTLGFHIDTDTVDWWKKQSKEATASLQVNRVDIESALKDFAEWYGPKSLKTWSKGANFDLPVIAESYRIVFGNHARTPWKYWDGVCMRTIELFYPFVETNERVAHNALDDAETQAKHLLSFFKDFGWFDENSNV